MEQILKKIDISKLAACHECDLLVIKPELLMGEKIVCPRCKALMGQSKTAGISRTLALVIAGLLLYLPANFLPILNLEIMGIYSSNTLFSAVVSIYQGGLAIVALMVLFCSMLAPFVSLLLLFMVISCVQMDKFISILPILFRFHGHLDSWAMLEVYMISLLVAAIKLLDMAQIHMGIGLFCFIGLMLTYIGAKITLEKEDIWKMIEAAQQNKKSHK